MPLLFVEIVWIVAQLIKRVIFHCNATVRVEIEKL